MSSSIKRPKSDVRTPELHTVNLHALGGAAGGDLSALVNEARTATGASAAAVALMSNNGEFVCQAHSGDASPSVGARLEDRSGISGLCIRTGLPVLCADAEFDDRVNKPVCRRLGIRSILAVPVVIGEQDVVGLLEVFSSETGAFTGEHLSRLGEIAEQVASIAQPSTRLAVVADKPVVNSSFTVEQPVTSSDEARHAVPEPADNDTSVAAGHNIQAGWNEAEPLSPTITAPLSRSGTPWPAIAVAALVAASCALLSLGWWSADRAPSFGEPVTAEEQTSAEMQAVLRRTQSGDSAAALLAAHDYAAGNGVRQDQNVADRWLRAAAEQGNAQAQYELGLRLANKTPSGSSEAATEWLRRAGEQGHPDALFRLGQAYASGNGAPRDVVRAYTAFILADANGHREAEGAMRSLGPVSDAQLAEVRAQVGERYAHGYGVRADPVTAYMWLLLADVAAPGHGQPGRNRLASKMADAERREAEHRASEWLRRHGLQPKPAP